MVREYRIGLHEIHRLEVDGGCLLSATGHMFCTKNQVRRPVSLELRV